MVRTVVLVPEALVAAGALSALLLPRPLLKLAAPVAAPGLALVALAVELWLGGAVGSLFNGSVAVDRFGLFAKAAVLLALLLATAAADWEIEDAPGALPFAYLGALGAMVAASATTLPAVWMGLALAVAAPAIGLGAARTGVAADRAARAAAASGVVVAVALTLLAGVGLAFLAAEAGTWNLASMRTSLGAGLGPGVSLPAAIVSVLGLGSIAVVLVLAPLGFGGGFPATSSPLARGAAAGLGSLGAGIVLVKVAAALTPLWQGWSPALLVGGAACALLGGLFALAAAGTRRRFAALAVSQLGWVIMASATHDRAGLAAALLALGAAGLALAAGPVLLAELEAGTDTGAAALAGLGRRHPGRGAGLLLAAASLAALPPLGGFIGDFAVGAALAATSLFWPVAVAVTGSLLASFAVLRLAHGIFLEQELEEAAVARAPRAGRAAATRVEISPATVGPVVVTVLLAAFTLFANPISGLAVQGAEALGLLR